MRMLDFEEGGGVLSRGMDCPFQVPLLLTPVYKEYIWGGERLITEFHRRLLPGRYAESWEIADHPDGRTRILNGCEAGLTLSEALARHPAELLGPGHASMTRFPLMVKVIDAKETLSVQVHPDDESASRVGGEAKSEMWVVLAATPDAHIYSGFRPGVTPDEFQAALATGTIPSLLQRYPARPGMVFYTPGGRVHAIGAGCLLLEIQQDANTTYRLYDWDRLGLDGKPRPLHLEKALQVIRWEDTASPVAPVQPELPFVAGAVRRELLETPHFHVQEWRIEDAADLELSGASFHILFPVDAPVRIKVAGEPAMILARGTTCLIPAACSRLSIRPDGDSGTSARILVAELP